MRSWFWASLCTLGLSYLNSHVFVGHDWSVYEYFVATSVFGIFLKIKE